MHACGIYPILEHTIIKNGDEFLLRKAPVCLLSNVYQAIVLDFVCMYVFCFGLTIDSDLNTQHTVIKYSKMFQILRYLT